MAVIRHGEAGLMIGHIDTRHIGRVFEEGRRSLSGGQLADGLTFLYFAGCV